MKGGDGVFLYTNIMKITNNYQMSIAPKTLLGDTNIKKNNIQSKDGKYDKISIQTGIETTDSQFLINMKNKVLNEIKSETKADKIHQIKSEIYSGEYIISSEEIARKFILGL